VNNLATIRVGYPRVRYQGALRLSRTLLASVAACLILCSCGMGRERGQQSGKEAPPGRAAAGADPAPSKQQPKPTAPADPAKFAIIISGVGGEDVYTKKFTSQAFRIQDALTTRFGFPEKNVTLLTETGATGAEDGFAEPDRPGGGYTGRSTADEVRKAFDRVKATAKPNGLLLVVMIGHGSFDNQEPKFNLVGPDFAAKDYAKLLASVPIKRIVFINSSSCSGEFVKPLSADGRIVITATRSGNEQNITTFAENFIRAITEDAADTDKNGRLSILEIFNYASKLTADGYKEKDQLATEHALLDDNGDGVGHEKAEAGDGALAAATYLDSKPIQEASGDADLAKLLERRQQLEDSIAALKAKKAQMEPQAYDAELEKLLIELSKLNQDIKSHQKEK